MARLRQRLGRFLTGRGAAWLSLALALGLPAAISPQRLDLAVFALLYVTLALGLNITVGFAGLLDLGYVAFYAVGAYTYGILNYHYKVPFILALPLGGAMAGLAGLLLGSPTLRLRGDYLAIVTLGFAQMTQIVLKNWESVTKGVNGIIGIERPSIFGYLAVKRRGIYLHHGDAKALLEVAEQVPFYYLALALAVLAIVATRRLEVSRIGRALMAIREDETAAQAMGINTSALKLLAFVMGATWAGFAGVLFASKFTFISPESFTFLESVMILSMVVLGGMGSIPGVVVGALVLYLVPELLRDLDKFLPREHLPALLQGKNLAAEFARYRMLIFGMLMVAMMIWRPQGLLPSAAIRREARARREGDG